MSGEEEVAQCRSILAMTRATMMVCVTPKDTIDTRTRPCGVVTAAAKFGVSPSTMRRLANAGEIAHLRVGRRGIIKFLPQHLDAYERRVTVAAADA